jgi:hypothetical protein
MKENILKGFDRSGYDQNAVLSYHLHVETGEKLVRFQLR